VDRRGLKGIILSGGPASVYAEDAPRIGPEVLQLGLPVLGICYGMQLMTELLGGEVEPGTEREFGPATLEVDGDALLFEGVPNRSAMPVWMSHGDRLLRPADGFKTFARSQNSPFAAVGDPERRLFGVQFHPEVHHTPQGPQILRNFLVRVCGCRMDWTMGSFIDEAVERIRRQVGESQVICGLSGGVDSSVVAALLARAIPGQVSCVFVDNGLLRKGEAEETESFFGMLDGIDFVTVRAGDRFLGALSGIDDPEVKRKTIGRVFVEVFEEEAHRHPDARFLAQGTLYPDVIESVSSRGGPSVTIKTHHNVGGLPDRMRLELVEPLRWLFKDEVRVLGRELGLPPERVGRHPFPGPGLAVRILGEVLPERCAILRDADFIVRSEIRSAGLHDAIWQVFAVLLPVKTVGVMGDERTYEMVCAVRAVDSVDGMTADWSRIPHEVLARISNRIINEVRGINRVVYDITSKPPGTIEWE
jgi:GMP synthase (glutamine-hydrolysing)